MGIPSGPDAITAGWLASVLREGGAINRENVVSVSVSPFADASGLTGQISRLSVDYDLEDAGAPKSLIAKISSVTPEMRNHPNTIFAYEREVRFYQEIAHQTTLPTPAFYYGAVDTETGMHVLLLEDLAPAVSGSRVAGCSPEQAELAVRHIARFHVDWWESPQLGEICWLSDARDPYHNPDAAKVEYERWWTGFFEKTKHLLPDQIREFGEDFGPHRAAIEHYLFSESPQTLLHGDYHLGNLVFGTPEGGVPFAILDWQSLRRGRGVRDVAYFLSENLQIEDRRAIEMGLLRDYHQTLIDNGVGGYSFEQCLHDYKLSLLQRFRALASTIAAMPFAKDEIQMHIDILLPRNIAAILDHNAGELLSH